MAATVLRARPDNRRTCKVEADDAVNRDGERRHDGREHAAGRVITTPLIV